MHAGQLPDSLRAKLPARKAAVPFFVASDGYFARTKCALNPSSLRLLARHGDATALEVFITATTTRWVCFTDAERSSVLHCASCPIRQQRECVVWSLGRFHYFQQRTQKFKDTAKWFVEHPLTERARRCLALFSLRLQRVYRVTDVDVVTESEAYF